MPFKTGNYKGRDVRPEVSLRQRYLWLFKFSYLRRAKRKGHAVEITEDQFITLVTSNCHYCGRSHKEETRRVNKALINMLTIDRVDPSKGYVISNCVPACKRCNTIKMDMAYQEFIDRIKQIYQHLKLT